MLFVVAPGLVALAPGWLVVPGIWAGALTCLGLLLHDRTFDRAVLWRRPTRSALLRVTLRATAGGLLLIAGVAWLAPARLFHLPRHQPLAWLVLMLAYPLLSALPQELAFRVFFVRCLDQSLSKTALLILGTAAFAWAHVVMHNGVALAVSAGGGLIFGATYLRERSLPLVALEHALWGNILFTVGMDAFLSAPG